MIISTIIRNAVIGNVCHSFTFKSHIFSIRSMKHGNNRGYRYNLYEKSGNYDEYSQNDDEDYYEPFESAFTKLNKEEYYESIQKKTSNISSTFNHTKSLSTELNYKPATSRFASLNLRSVRFENERKERNEKKERSENFEVYYDTDINFTSVGGYENVKEELLQCSDTLLYPEKYKEYNVRTPKGIIFEGPPGNGKTLIAKSFCGEIGYSFIPVSGSQFQEKYVGVGSARIRELFDLAAKNKPCIIFIDEIDAIGRKRENADSSNAERDSTLNELLVQMDGFKTLDGIFIICATNRFDLLDDALIRPGRIDKRVYIGNPNKKTRMEIINVHMLNKPCDKTIDNELLSEITNGLSGAQIENLLNEAMLLALRQNKTRFDMTDLEICIGKTYAGFQAIENAYSNKMIRRIAVHELGHAISGMLQKSHSKLSGVHLNSFSPKTPGYTIFETNEVDANIFTKEALFARLVVLLSGRMAELVLFQHEGGVTTGASHDFEEARKLATEMIQTYGMGSHNIFPVTSDKSKEIIDKEVNNLLHTASSRSHYIIEQSKGLIQELSEMLILKNKISTNTIELKIYRKYPHLLQIKFD